MIWDTHMHTEFSGDSDAAPEAMAEEAIRRGLSGICFTDHMDYDYPQEPNVFTFEPDAYMQKMRAVQQDFAGRLPIRIGIELGLQPHLSERHRALLSSFPFDFVIGSSHIVHGKDPYYPPYFEGRTEHEAYLEYFESILENIAAFDEFDVYGHIDYVVRYGPNKNQNYSYHAYREVIDEILRTLIQKGKGIEINTAGFKYGLGHPNPTEEILARYLELGGEILTIGSDGHAPEQIAWDFDRVPQLLKACGFTHFTVFKNRKPEFLPLFE